MYYERGQRLVECVTNNFKKKLLRIHNAIKMLRHPT